MRLLLDMNLSPQLRPRLRADGHDVIHRSEIGDPRAIFVDVASAFLVALGVFWFVSRSYA
jgi:predicted nuclease of predicted toxin-antitoxin system